jgi:hypothetical protein
MKMEPVEQALEDFFAATEAPVQDDAFVWRVIEEYERRTRIAALAWKALQAGCAAATGLAILAVLAGLEPAAQAAIAEAIRGAILIGTVGTAIVYAGQSLFGGGPVLALPSHSRQP